jgi:hypothetical protein
MYICADPLAELEPPMIGQGMRQRLTYKSLINQNKIKRTYCTVFGDLPIWIDSTERPYPEAREGLIIPWHIHRIQYQNIAIILVCAMNPSVA